MGGGRAEAARWPGEKGERCRAVSCIERSIKGWVRVVSCSEQGSFEDIVPGLFKTSNGTAADAVNGCLGYKSPQVQQVTGVTYRQLDYWARTGLVSPSIRPASGSGSQRMYAFSDIVVVKVIRRLLEAGVSLQNVRIAIECLRARDAQGLASVTLLCDGISVYECTSDDEIVDLLHGGQGVFGIAIGHTVADVAADIRALPAVSVGSDKVTGIDELRSRRDRKSA